MKKRRIQIINGILLTAMISTALCGCGNTSTVSEENNTNSVSEMQTSSVVAESNEIAAEEESTVEGGVFNELTFTEPASWADVKQYESDDENHTMNLDYYLSPEATVSFMFYGYSEDALKDENMSMPLAVSVISDAIYSMENMSAVRSINTLPTNTDVVSYCVEGELTEPDGDNTAHFNSKYYFFGSDTGVYQIWLTVLNTVDYSEYEKDFKEVYKSIVLNNEEKTERTEPKMVTLLRNEMHTIPETNLSIMLSEDAEKENTYDVYSDDQKMDIQLNITDEEIDMDVNNIEDTANIELSVLVGAEIVNITSPETGGLLACYDVFTNMIGQATEEPTVNEAVEITHKKNVYSFVFDEESKLHIKVTLR